MNKSHFHATAPMNNPTTAARMNRLNSMSSQRRSLEVVSRQSSKNEVEIDDPSKRHSLTSTAPQQLSQKQEQIRRQRQRQHEQERLRMKQEVNKFRNEKYYHNHNHNNNNNNNMGNKEEELEMEAKQIELKQKELKERELKQRQLQQQQQRQQQMQPMQNNVMPTVMEEERQANNNNNNNNNNNRVHISRITNENSNGSNHSSHSNHSNHSNYANPHPNGSNGHHSRSRRKNAPIAGAQSVSIHKTKRNNNDSNNRPQHAHNVPQNGQYQAMPHQAQQLYQHQQHQQHQYQSQLQNEHNVSQGMYASNVNVNQNTQQTIVNGKCQLPQTQYTKTVNSHNNVNREEATHGTHNNNNNPYYKSKVQSNNENVNNANLNNNNNSNVKNNKHGKPSKVKKLFNKLTHHGHGHKPKNEHKNNIIVDDRYDDDDNHSNVATNPSNPSSRHSSNANIGSMKRRRNSKHKNKVKVAFKLEDEIFVLYRYYEPKKKLGRGAYAVVCEAVDTRTDQSVAIKKNRNVFVNLSDAKRILREIKLLGMMNHENIMHLLTTVPPEPHEIETFNEVYLVMPKMDRSLSQIIRSEQKLSEKHIQYFMYQICKGLAYIHSGDIIHRDLKPDNVLVNQKDCHLKITDFGLARGVSKDDHLLTEYVVTRWYRAPEVMVCSRRYNEKVDMWAAGCIAGELYTRKPLFKGRNHIEQLQLIFHYLGTPRTSDWITAQDAKIWIDSLPPKNGKNMRLWFPKASPEACSFINGLLAINPNNRMTAIEALKHPWLKDFYNKKEVLKQCPHFDLSYEFEQSLNTEFGVRNMMYEEVSQYKKNRMKIISSSKK